MSGEIPSWLAVIFGAMCAGMLVVLAYFIWDLIRDEMK